MNKRIFFVPGAFCFLLTAGIGCSSTVVSTPTDPVPTCGAAEFVQDSLHFGGCAQLGAFRVSTQLAGSSRDAVTTRLESRALGAGYALRAVLELPASATEPVRIEGLSISGGVADDAAATVRLVPQDRPLRQLANGFHIFSYAGVVSLPATIDATVDEPHGINLDADEIRAGTSWWWMGLRRDDTTAPTLFAGALSARVWRTFLAVNGAAVEPELHIRSGFLGDPAKLTPGGSLASEWVWIAAGRDWEKVLIEYADLVASENAVNPSRGSVSIWSSWHSDFAAIDETVIAHRLDLLAQADNDLIEVAQIDDGWQERWGDWTDGPAFPHGMTALAESMSSRGFVPGLWVAPALIDEESATALAHPDWLLRDAQGETIVCTFCSSPDRDFGPIAVLDLSVVEVQHFVRDVFARLVSEGFRFFKIDFTLLATDPLGIASDGSTGMQRYGKLMEAIAAGSVLPEGGMAYRNVIGSPFLGPVGFAEATRFGPDLAYTLVPEELPWESIKAQARNYSGRWFMANRAFTADLDAAYQRPGVPIEDVRTSVAVMSLAAGFYHIGDRIDELDEALRLTLFNPTLRNLVATMEPAVPMDMWSSGGTAVGLTPAVSIFRGFEPTEGYPPSIWRANRPQGAVWYFFNWTDEDQWVPVGQYLQGHTYNEVWSQSETSFMGLEMLQIPAHAARIYWR